MATLARTEVLERKLHKHIREHADDMRNLKNELQILKTKPRVSSQWDQRPFNDNTTKKLGHHLKNEHAQKLPAKSLKRLEADGKSTILNNNRNSPAGDKMTNKIVSALLYKMQTHFLCSYTHTYKFV